jgi:cation diffusion facilitator CzcD-associated flavoprotein CzcO
MNLLLKKCPPSACYRDLLTNTFTETFAYPDFPFPEGTPKLCHHSVVSKYFADYAEHFDLFPLIELNTSVNLVTKDKETGNWVLSLSKYDVNPGGMIKISRWKETFDAVVCATGKHQEPFVPDIKNLTAWNKTYPSKVSHSNQFRRPEDFIDKVRVNSVYCGYHLTLFVY